MRRFLIVLFLTIVVLVLFDFAYYRWGFYIPTSKDTVVISYTDKGNMLRNRFFVRLIL